MGMTQWLLLRFLVLEFLLKGAGNCGVLKTHSYRLLLLTSEGFPGPAGRRGGSEGKDVIGAQQQAACSQTV